MVMDLTVNEIFYSIQGESSFAGSPCVFVRLTGCNLRCVWCDTVYAYEEGYQATVGHVVSQVAGYSCSLVEITGGEPLLQVPVRELTQRLLDKGHTVLVETNGSQDISLLDPRCVIIIDFKLPSSGMEHHNDYRNIERLRSRDEVKLVIGDRRDYEASLKLIERIRTRRPSNTVHLSPVWSRLDPKVLANWILRDKLKVRLSLQLHKVIWGPNERGV
jgi:7-carboxy-7-deazaguanine synthase